MKINKELKELIESKPLSFSTVNKALAPHTIYIMYVKIVEENKILITDNYMKKTKANILFNKNVSLSLLVGEAGFEFKGKAEYFSTGPLIEQVKRIPENKGFPCKGAILVSIKEIIKMG